MIKQTFSLVLDMSAISSIPNASLCGMEEEPSDLRKRQRLPRERTSIRGRNSVTKEIFLKAGMVEEEDSCDEFLEIIFLQWDGCVGQYFVINSHGEEQESPHTGT